jgi:hypothetical protein
MHNRFFSSAYQSLRKRKTCASVMANCASTFAATLGLPVFRRSYLAADGFPRFAFAVLFVKVLEELGGFFRAQLARLKRLLLLFLVRTVAIAGTGFRLLFRLLLLTTTIAVGTLSITATRLALISLVLLVLILLVLGTG